VVGIKVISENVKTHTVKHTNTSYFTMVAMDENHAPLQVPGLILHTDVEIRRFFQGLHRKQLKKYYRQEEDRVKSDFEMTETIELLKGERCKVER
jgi:acyl-CoA hydrolase